MREVKDLWNPNKQWELPICCFNPNYNSMFKAFLRKCAELEGAWNNDLQKYQFHCPECGFYINQSPSIVQVFEAYKGTLLFHNQETIPL